MRGGEVRQEVRGLGRSLPADAEQRVVLPDLEADPREQRAVRIGLDLRRLRRLACRERRRGSATNASRSLPRIAIAPTRTIAAAAPTTASRRGASSCRATQHRRERDERGREPEHGRERAGDDRPEDAADDRDDRERPRRDAAAARATATSPTSSAAPESAAKSADERNDACRLPTVPARKISRAEELRDADGRRDRAPEHERPERQHEVARAPDQQRQRRREQRVLRELRRRHSVRVPRVRRRVDVAVRDLDEHPGEEQPDREPEPAAARERREAVAEAAPGRRRRRPRAPRSPTGTRSRSSNRSPRRTRAGSGRAGRGSGSPLRARARPATPSARDPAPSVPEWTKSWWPRTGNYTGVAR